MATWHVMFSLGLSISTLFGHDVFIPQWTILPDSVPYFTSASHTERGLAYNPVTGNVLLVSRAAAVGGLEIEVLSKQTGAKLGTLDTTGIVGGLFSLSQIDVADDGAIYAANLTLGATTNPYKIYRWANESALPTLAFAGDPGLGLNMRWGDNLRVRGAGADTQILTAAGLGNTNAAFFTTLEGTIFMPTRLDVSNLPPGGISLGLAFGEGNTFYGRRNFGSLRTVSFDPLTNEATVIAINNLLTASGNVSAIGVNLSAERLVGVAISGAAGQTQWATLYDLNEITGFNTVDRLDEIAFPTMNPNDIAVGGAVDWDEAGETVFVLDTNNGIMALAIPEPAMTSTLIVGLIAFALCRRRRGT